MAYETLFQILSTYKPGANTFNQYAAASPTLDLPDADALRLRNLELYLDAFADARYLLVGEAAGYAGCRFSGIPFTCEAQLLGPAALSWTKGRALSHSSRADRPWTERSATMVWDALGERRDCLLWNAFPWHPIGSSGPLTNRAPGRDVTDGLEALQWLSALIPQAQPIAVGRVAERALGQIGIVAPYVRHPSRGGKRKFVEGLRLLPVVG
ncbi:uracil-DNA glycosylase [Chloroflexota bacterium]